MSLALLHPLPRAACTRSRVGEQMCHARAAPAGGPARCACRARTHPQFLFQPTFLMRPVHRPPRPSMSRPVTTCAVTRGCCCASICACVHLLVARAHVHRAVCAGLYWHVSLYKCYLEPLCDTVQQ